MTDQPGRAAVYRTGRHNRGIVYKQVGEKPSDHDSMVAVTMPGHQWLAGLVVNWLNGTVPPATCPNCNPAAPEEPTHG